MRAHSITPPPPVHIDLAQSSGKSIKAGPSESTHHIVTPLVIRTVPKTPSPPPIAGAFTKALSSLAMPKSTVMATTVVTGGGGVTEQPSTTATTTKRVNQGPLKRGFSLLGAFGGGGGGSKNAAIQTSSSGSDYKTNHTTTVTASAPTSSTVQQAHSPIPSCEELLDGSRPPSLITDNSSFTESSRSPSPEPGSASISKLESAFRSYTASESPRILYAVLLPLLAATTTAKSPLEEAEIGVLFKWWNHLLLVSRPSQSTIQAILAIARHPALIEAAFWSAHYELTLSTIMCRTAAVLPCHHFSRLLAIGYLYHTPTTTLLKSLFADPTKVRGDEP